MSESVFSRNPALVALLLARRALAFWSSSSMGCQRTSTFLSMTPTPAPSIGLNSKRIQKSRNSVSCSGCRFRLHFGASSAITTTYLSQGNTQHNTARTTPKASDRILALTDLECGSCVHKPNVIIRDSRFVTRYSVTKIDHVTNVRIQSPNDGVCHAQSELHHVSQNM
jgi:hypothetical protein